MKLKFKAQKADGSFYESEREGADAFSLARELRAEGETLIHANETAQPARGGFRLFVGGHVGLHDKVIFARNLGGMLGAGLALSRALGVLARQTRHAKLKSIIAEVNAKISSGANLSSALAEFPKVFPMIMISMVKAGEEGGNLATSLREVAEQLDRAYQLSRKVRGALMYPAVVLTAMLVIGTLMFIYVVPQLTASFSQFNVELPFSTRVVIVLSNFIKDHLILGLVALAALPVLILAAARSVRGKRGIDFALLHIPVISSIVKEVNAARTGQTLSSLLSSGVEVVTALDITSNVLQNSYYKEVLLAAKERIQKGEPISGVFREHENIYPPFLSEMVAVGEETGKLAPMLKETGIFFEAEVEQKTKDLSTIVEPVLMVVIGAAVGFFAIAMISPAYSLMNSI